MDYQQMHQDSLANRRAKVTTQAPHNKLDLSDLGKVAPENVRASAFRHFSNLLQSYRLTSNSSAWTWDKVEYHKRRAISDLAEKWNFELPEWF